MKLKIYLKKLQMFDKNEPVYYIGTNPNTLQTIKGKIPDNDWIDFTADAENIEVLNLLWKKKTEGNNVDISNIDKGSSDEIIFTNKAYRYIREWMIDDVAAPLNRIEVKIGIDNGTFSGFVIKSEGLSYSDEDQGCQIGVMLKQKDDVFTCIQTTMITDNHIGMFSGKYEHPRFSYCNEFRPTWLLTLIWSIQLMTYIWNVMMLPVVRALGYIVLAINAVVSMFSKEARERKAKIKAFLEETKIDNYTKKYVDSMAMAAGCGREHPAPLVRDYISNVCSKCGVTVNSQTAPIFFDPTSDYYNTTYFSPEVKKGIDEDDPQPYWINDNKPLLTLDMFLNKLKVPFNSKWYIKNNTLYFDRKDFDDVSGYIYDFAGRDKSKIIEGVEYNWNENKKPAYARGGYSVDGFDNMTSDTKERFNDVVEFNNPVNPGLEGEGNKTFELAAARFRGDGVYKDYISESLSKMWIAAIFSGGLSNIPLNSLKKKLEHFKGAILMQNETVSIPKLIIWDGQSKRFAKAKFWHQFGGNMPAPNPVYNPGKKYTEVHVNDVPYDDYYNEFNKLYNYPLAFDAMFTGNLYDRFHQIDDPRINPPLNKNFELKISLCLDDLERLGVLDESENVAIGRKVKLDGGQYYKEGYIDEVELSFDPFDKLGRWIKIKGTM